MGGVLGSLDVPYSSTAGSFATSPLAPVLDLLNTKPVCRPFLRLADGYPNIVEYPPARAVCSLVFVYVFYERIYVLITLGYPVNK